MTFTVLSTMNPNTLPNTNESNKLNNTWLPDGFALVIGPDNKEYIMPELLIPDLVQIYKSEEKKQKYLIPQARGIVSSIFGPLNSRKYQNSSGTPEQDRYRSA